VRLYSRPGNDLTYRFPLIVETLARLRSRSCIIDGEAVACDDNGVTLFNRVRYRRHDESIFLYAFDLIELNGDDLRRDPLEGRKATLEMILAKAGPGIRFNEHMDGDGETVFRHACKLGLEGIVSKRKDSTYRSGRSPDWLKMKNAEAPAVKRDLHEVGRNRLDEWASGGGLAVGDGYGFRLFDVTVICITAFPCVSFYKETMTAFPRGGRHGNEIKQTGIRSRSNFRCGGIRDDQHIGRRKT
jgi:bifunctional non-homologous end joining protein LigD